MALTNNPDVQKGIKRMKMTASGIVPGIGPGNEFFGVVMTTAGTTTTASCYDAASADANNLLAPTSATLTAGQYVGPFGGVVPITAAFPVPYGAYLNTGLYLAIGGTGSPVFWVLYR